MDHPVQPSETLFAIAAKYGLKVEDIHDDPQNAALKKIRPDPGVLRAGDSFFIPNKEMKQQPSAVDAMHTFNVPNPKAWLRLYMQNADGTPLAGKPFELTVGGKSYNGTTAADGLLKQAVSVYAASGTLKIEGCEWELKIGYRNPIAEVSGVKDCLFNLGFYSGAIDETVDDDTSAAVKAFQEAATLETTGVIDDALRNALASKYGVA